jgi:hypothetical protein
LPFGADASARLKLAGTALTPLRPHAQATAAAGTTPGVRLSRECRLKRSRMELATLLSVLSTLALVGALIFAGLQVRSANRAREEQNAVKLIDAALSTVLAQPHSFFAELSPKAEDVKAYSPDVARMLQETGFRLEALGYLVYRHVVPLRSVEELMGGMITLWWTRIKPLAERDREKTQNPRMFEWAQWLAERVTERRTGTESEPAFRAHADWH